MMTKMIWRLILKSDTLTFQTNALYYESACSCLQVRMKHGMSIVKSRTKLPRNDRITSFA